MNHIYTYILLVSFFMISCGTDTKVPSEVSDEATAGISISQKQLKALGIEFGKLEQVSFPEYISVRGIIDVPPTHRASINVFYGGYVQNLDLLPGQEIMKGALLFTLQNPEFIGMQEAYLETKANLDFLESDYKRQQQLSKESISSDKKFKQAESEYLMAKSRLAGLERQLELINIDTKKLTPEKMVNAIPIYAPITGFVSNLAINKGAYLSAEREAMQIINPEHKHLELKVYEKDAARIKVGQQVKFRINELDACYSGEVHMIEKAINQEDRTVQVHCHLPDENASLIVGMYVQADIQVNTSQSYALPRDAVVDMDGKQLIVVKSSVNGDEIQFEYLNVTIGSISGDLIEVLNASELLGKEIVLKGAYELIN